MSAIDRRKMISLLTQGSVGVAVGAALLPKAAIAVPLAAGRIGDALPEELLQEAVVVVRRPPRRRRVCWWSRGRRVCAWR